jgi:hypothetical protein
MTIPVQLGARTDAEKSVPILRNIPILGTYFARKDGVVVPMAGIEAHPGGTIYRKADPEGTPFEASFQYYSTREGQHVVTVPSTTTVTTSKSGRVTMEGATVVTEEPDLETRLERLEARLEKLTTILEGLLEKVGEGK